MQDTLASPHTMCTTTVTWQIKKMQLSPGYGCMGLSDLEEKDLRCWSTGKESRKRTSQQQTPPWTTETSTTATQWWSLGAWTIQRASRPRLCLGNSLQPRLTALSRNYVCHSFLCHQGLTSLTCQQGPARGLIPGADGLRWHQGADLVSRWWWRFLKQTRC